MRANVRSCVHWALLVFDRSFTSTESDNACVIFGMCSLNLQNHTIYHIVLTNRSYCYAAGVPGQRQSQRWWILCVFESSNSVPGKEHNSICNEARKLWIPVRARGLSIRMGQVRLFDSDSFKERFCQAILYPPDVYVTRAWFLSDEPSLFFLFTYLYGAFAVLWRWTSLAAVKIFWILDI